MIFKDDDPDSIDNEHKYDFDNEYQFDFDKPTRSEDGYIDDLSIYPTGIIPIDYSTGGILSDHMRGVIFNSEKGSDTDEVDCDYKKYQGESDHPYTANSLIGQIEEWKKSEESIKDKYPDDVFILPPPSFIIDSLGSLEIERFDNKFTGGRPDLETPILLNLYREELNTLNSRGRLLNWSECVCIDEQTDDICFDAISKTPELLCTIKRQTERIVLEAVSNEGFTLEFAKIQTPNICRVAITDEPHAIEFVSNQTEELCNLAISLDPSSIVHIKDQTEEMCWNALNYNPWYYEYIKNPTEEMKAKAIKENRYLISFMKDMPLIAKYINLIKNETIFNIYSENNKLSADDFILRNIFKSPFSGQLINTFTDNLSEDRICDLLEKVPRHIKFINKPTERMQQVAVSIDGLLIKYLSNPSEETCLLAVASEGRALEFIKDQTEAICKVAVDDDPLALEFVINQTEEICEMAVRENGWVIRFVKKQTSKICLLAARSLCGISGKYCNMFDFNEVMDRIELQYRKYVINNL